MHALLAFLMTLGLTVAKFIGVRYGWGYHASILFTLGALMTLLIRLPLGFTSSPKFDATVFDTPEGRELGAKVAALHAENQRFHRMLRVDAFLFPILLFGPAFVTMLVLRQNAYREEHRHWFWVGLALFGLYFVFRHVISRRKHA